MEWKRRGAIAGAGVGADHKNGDITAHYREFLSQGYDGIFIDEIHMWGKEAQVMASELPKFRQACPEAFVALWTIGEDTVPEIAELVKNKTVDLLMLEVYLKPGDDISAHDRAVENMRKLGIADKTLIGLVTHKEWDTWVSAEEQTADILAQMRHIRKIAPEMPGFAFWSDDAKHGVIEAVDKECFRLFIEGDENLK